MVTHYEIVVRIVFLIIEVQLCDFCCQYSIDFSHRV